MTLLRDLITIPESVQRGDFVLRLSEGVNDPAATLGSYVVTPQLAQAFDQALDLIRSALGHGGGRATSKAAYLHGSFGSGKSHFMAVLHLLLTGNTAARSIPELAGVIAKHDSWLQGRRFLLVPYHMVGKEGMEQAVFDGYLSRVQALHPEAKPPSVFLAEPLFDDAERLRAKMGDAAFFGHLNEGGADSGGWGDLSDTWNAEAFDRARLAPPGDDQRLRLVGCLVKRFFSQYGTIVSSSNESFVDLDLGLEIVAKHASGLGYDGLVLFLDELILWLASHASDASFINQEGQKLTKLVEAQHADRKIPIVSFIARQRDLRDLVGEQFTGIQQLNFNDVLKHWEARFGKISLEDRNLPAIIEKRILKPVSEAARQELDGAFKKTEGGLGAGRDILLTATGDSAMFRQVYPFSPALVEVLVTVSSLLQRERTAIKVLVELLVQRRDTLAVGDLVPVGDIYDVLADGDEPFMDIMRARFIAARTLYEQKLRPMLEAEHQARFAELSTLPPERGQALRNDDRLVKTLLLSALADNAEAFRMLDARKLAMLNHGTIRTPIPGREADEVLRKVRKWASQVGEIRLSDDTSNPTFSVQLTGVDTDAIIEKVASHDNDGTRRALVRDLLFRAFEIEGGTGLYDVYPRECEWRKTKRTVDVLYLNVREARADVLRGGESRWKLVIDYPFDAAGHSPADDLSRLEAFLESEPAGTRTIVWIPSFLSAGALSDLGKLVRLEHLLSGERYDAIAVELPLVQRQSARVILENQRSQLRIRMAEILAGAYGVAAAPVGTVDETLRASQHLRSLDPGVKLGAPAGGNLKGALEALLAAVLEQENPGHPDFAEKPSITNLRKLSDVLEGGRATGGNRFPVDRTLRSLMTGIAVPLKLGEMGDTHFVPATYWRGHIDREHAREGGGELTVGAIRTYLDRPQRMGLPAEVQNFLILCYAADANCSFRLFGGGYDAGLDNLRDDVVLIPQELPTEGEWRIARDRAAALFGLTSPEHRTATALERFAEGVTTAVAKLRPNVDALREQLGPPLREFAPSETPAPREQELLDCDRLLRSLNSSRPLDVVRTLAAYETTRDFAQLGRCMSGAEGVAVELRDAPWEIYRALSQRAEPAAKALLVELREALPAIETAKPLAARLRDAKGRAIRLIVELVVPDSGVKPPVVGPVPPPPDRTKPPTPGIEARGERQVNSLAELDGLMSDLRKLIDETHVLHVRWSVERKPKP